MNPEIKTKWLEALRSGEYEQARGSLTNRKGSFCCLGVLCELALADGATSKKDTGVEILYGEKFDTGHVNQDFGASVLPDNVVRWAGLGIGGIWGSNPEISPQRDLISEVLGEDECPTNLAAANDAGADFNRIADIIESEL